MRLLKETGKVIAVSAKASPQVNAIIADWERVALGKVGKMYGDMLRKGWRGVPADRVENYG